MATDPGLDEAMRAHAKRMAEIDRYRKENSGLPGVFGVGGALLKYGGGVVADAAGAVGGALAGAAADVMPAISGMGIGGYVGSPDVPTEAIQRNVAQAQPSASSRPTTPLPDRPASAKHAPEAPPAGPKPDYTMPGVTFPPAPTPAPSAPTPTPSSVRYKTAGGEWKDYRRGPTGTEPSGPGMMESASAGSAPNSGTATYKRLEDPGFGPSPNPETMPIGQRPASWFDDRKRTAEDSGLTAAIGQNQANLARSNALAKNPWAEKGAETDYRIALEQAMSSGRIGENRAKIQDTAQIQGGQNQRERQEFNNRWQEIEGQASGARQRAQATITDPARLKAALAEIDAQHESDLMALKTGFGVSERISSQSLYR